METESHSAKRWCSLSTIVRLNLAYSAYLTSDLETDFDEFCEGNASKRQETVITQDLARQLGRACCCEQNARGACHGKYAAEGMRRGALRVGSPSLAAGRSPSRAGVGNDWSLGQDKTITADTRDLWNNRRAVPGWCTVLYLRGVCENDAFELHGKRRKGDGIVLYSSTLRDVAYQLLVRTSTCDGHDQNDNHHMQGGVHCSTYRIC